MRRKKRLCGEECQLPTRSQFHQTTGAGFTREMNAWTLVADNTSGDLTVEHVWSYVDPFGDGAPDGGTTNVSVENFLSGNADDLIKEKLRNVLLNLPENKG
jgi:hypothetical protein